MEKCNTYGDHQDWLSTLQIWQKKTCSHLFRWWQFHFLRQVCFALIQYKFFLQLLLLWTAPSKKAHKKSKHVGCFKCTLAVLTHMGHTGTSHESHPEPIHHITVLSRQSWQIAYVVLAKFLLGSIYLFGVSIIVGLLEVVDGFFVGLNLYINMYLYSAYIVFFLRKYEYDIHENMHGYHIYS